MPSETYVALGSVTVSSAQSQITFSNIPQTYTDLILVSNIATASINPSIYMRFNGDSQTNYSFTTLYGNGTSAASTRGTNQSKAIMAWYVSPDTTMAMINTTQILNYSNNTINKNVISRANRGSANNSQGTEASVSLWRKTDAITSITLLPEANFSIGSTFNLYGIGATDLKATGGDIIQTDGTYWYHAFTKSGTFTPKTALTCDYLVIAGGGGGGTPLAGGGGAGGLRSTVGATGGGGSLESALSLSAGTNYTVTIGAGGGINLNGSNSTFSTITSTGGGRGGYYSSTAGATGGSGGGGGGGDGTLAGGSGTANQGYAGGSGNDGAAGGYVTRVGGGGGGAGAAGANANGSTNVAGNGGAGVQITAFATPTGTGVSGFYAGGGGGSVQAAGTAGAGGSGGGGRGGANVYGARAIANTGSGGGGTGQANGSPGFGGSGLVIVRYAV